MSLLTSEVQISYLSSMRDPAKRVQNSVFLSQQMGKNYCTDSSISVLTVKKLCECKS
jgi:hypothetical protein